MVEETGMVRWAGKIVMLAAAAGLAGCANDGMVSPSSLNEGIAISYGTVENVTPVQVSPTGEVAGSVMGGLLGLALTAGHSGGSMLLGTAGGALAGGLLGHTLQGSDRADQFMIRRTDGSTLEVTTEQRDLEVGDCVAIEQGRHTSLRRMPSQHCEPGPGVTADRRVALEAQHDAQVCHEAKEELLQAQGDAAIKAGAARVQALCNG
jgi:outer membrane lipoprotein SlyB